MAARRYTAIPTPSTLGTYVRQARERAGLSLRNLEAIVGVSRQLLLCLEHDEVDNPNPTLLHQHAQALELDSDDLFALVDYPPSTELPSLASPCGPSITDGNDDAVSPACPCTRPAPSVAATHSAHNAASVTDARMVLWGVPETPDLHRGSRAQPWQRLSWVSRPSSRLLGPVGGQGRWRTRWNLV